MPEFMDYLQERFPEMRPVTRPPTMFGINGFGTAVYGNRDVDPESGTYVKTLTLTALFIPLLSLGAYRVSNAPNGGWYFFGKVPLSRLAKTWNFLVVLLVGLGIGGGIWWNHYNSPEQKIARRVKAADELMAGGQHALAAKDLRTICTEYPSLSYPAKEKLAGLVDDTSVPAEQLAEVFQVLMDMQRKGNGPVTSVAKLYASGRIQAERISGTHPKEALHLLEELAGFAPDAKEELQNRLTMLEKIVKANAQDVDHGSKLGVIYSQIGQEAKSLAVLEPIAAKLESRDGAAILGQIYSRAGKSAEAMAILKPFVEVRLSEAIRNSDRVNNIFDEAEKRVIAELQNGTAKGFDFRKYDTSTKPQQSEMINTYLNERFRTDPNLNEARAMQKKEDVVVSAAMELGMLQLEMGRSAPDAAKREQQLKAAESTFLSLRSLGNQQGFVKLSLGQVYFWLGKPSEGKKEFDEYLKETNRNSGSLQMVSRVMREVGATTEAKKLAEEAYTVAKNDRDKFSAAAARSVFANDVDEKIEWLGKSDLSDPSIAADLSSQRGYQAQMRGNNTLAKEHFQRAIKNYEKLPETAANLNNAALPLLSLAEIDNDNESFTKAADKLDRALALMPTNSILMGNVLNTVLNAAYRSAAGNTINFNILKSGMEEDYLRYLYLGPDTRNQLVEKIRNHPGTIKGKNYLEKLSLLAPGKTDTYAKQEDLYSVLIDIPAMKALATKLKTAKLDYTDDMEKLKELLEDKDREKRKEIIAGQIVKTKEILAAAKTVGGVTYAIAVGKYVTMMIASMYYDNEIDLNALLVLAEEAHAMAPSSGTIGTLNRVLISMAHQDLIAADASYKSQADKCKRSVSANMLYVLLGTDCPLREKAVQLKSVKRMAELAKQSGELWPGYESVWEWVFMAATKDPQAKEYAKKLLASDYLKARKTVSDYTDKYVLNNAIENYLLAIALGKPDEAAKAFDPFITVGAPIPEFVSK